MEIKSIAEEHSAILSTFIKLTFVIKILVMSIFEWPFYAGFTVLCFVFQAMNALKRLLAAHSSRLV